MELYNAAIVPAQPPEERVPILYEEFISTREQSEDNPVVNLDARFSDLCLGNNRQSAEIAKNLKCYYENKRHPYFYVNPVKTEHLSENPPIYQFYDLIGEQKSAEI